MTKEYKTERTRLLRALDSSGTRHAIEEYTQFLRVRFLDGTFSEWTAARRKLTLNGEHVNMLDDHHFEVPSTGLRLTLETPGPQAPRA